MGRKRLDDKNKIKIQLSLSLEKWLVDYLKENKSNVSSYVESLIIEDLKKDKK